MTTIEALRLKIDTLQLEKQQFESQNLKLELENEQLKTLYEELLKKFEEEDTTKLVEGDKTNETATLVQQFEEQQINVVRLNSKCEQLEKSLESWKVKCNDLEKEVNALGHLRIYCEKLEKDLSDLEGWKRKCAELQQKVTQIENNAELECFRAVARERKQWEAREERLVQQLRELQQRIAELTSRVCHRSTIQSQEEAAKYPQTQQLVQQGEDIKSKVPKGIVTGEHLAQQGEDIKSKVPKGIVTDEHYHGDFYQGNLGFEGQSQFPSRNMQPLERTAGGYHYAQAVDYQQLPRVETAHDPVDSILPVCNESVTSTLLAQQLPPLPKFSGEMNDGDMDTFQDWFEQFEMIASVCGWSTQAKLVNLVTRLRGQAYAFFSFLHFSTED